MTTHFFGDTTVLLVRSLGDLDLPPVHRVNASHQSHPKTAAAKTALITHRVNFATIETRTFFCIIDKRSYAAVTSLNFCSMSLRPGFTSGCNFLASFRYALLISSALDEREHQEYHMDRAF